MKHNNPGEKAMSNHALLVASLLLTLTTTTSQAANAQQSTNAIEEIVVTAQKREQSVMDISIAIDVVTGKDLRERGASSLIDIAQHSPGVNIRGPFGDFSYPLIALRGVNTDGFAPTLGQSTGVYTDGVFISSPPMLALRLVDVERMEVLKGPQGTLYGRNTIGGAINFISAKPDFEQDGYLSTGYGRYNRTTTEGAYSNALSETVAARAAFKSVRQSDGPLRNLNPNLGDGGEIDQLFGRLSLLFQPSENFNARVEVHGGRDKSDNWPFALIPAGADTDNDGVPDVICDEFARGDVAAAQRNCLAADPFGSGNTFNDTDGDAYTNNLNAIGQSFSESVGATVEMNWELSNMLVTSLTGWDDFRRKDEVDEDAGPTTALDDVRRSEVDQFSQEIRLTSLTSANIQWLAGLYYSTDELVGDPAFDSGRQDFNSLATDTLGLFGQAEIPVAEQLKLTLGGRWSRVDREVFYRTTSGFASPELQAGASNDFTDSDYSLRVALDYQLNEDTLLYGSISRGFNAGTFNAGFLSGVADLEPTGSDSIIAYEIGTKAIFASGRASLEAAVFYYDYQDIQLIAVEPRDNLDVNILTNAEGATIKGFEFQLDAAATDWLNLALGVSYIDSELDSLVTRISGAGAGSVFPYNAPVFGSSDVNLAGNPLPNHPQWSYNGTVRVRRPVNQDWEAFGQLDVLWEDDIPRDLQGTRALFTEDHWNLDMQVGVESSDDKWRIALWARNLTDEEYITEAYQVVGFGFYIAGANYSYPRTYGITATRNF